jgi:hypothetical protein
LFLQKLARSYTPQSGFPAATDVPAVASVPQAVANDRARSSKLHDFPELEVTGVDGVVSLPHTRSLREKLAVYGL